MIGLICFLLAVVASSIKSKLRLEAENAVLGHQLNVLRRSLHGRVRVTNNDRWFLIQLYRWIPSHNHPARNAGPVASGRLSSLLALEIELAGRAPANRDRVAGTDQADQHREPALGCATHSRRTAQAWV